MNLTGFGLFLSGCVIGIVLVFAPCCDLNATVTPEKEIVPTSNQETPLWKSYWDNGRKLAREGDFSAAANYYRELLNRKPQIEEARWEYSKVLFNLGKYQLVLPVLETLLEVSPNNSEYLALAGFTALHSKEYSLAVKYLGQVYSLSPDGEQAIDALHGLVDALLGLNKNRNAHILLEQLYQRGVADHNTLKLLARLSVALGYQNKAIDYYRQLTGNDLSDTEVVREAATYFSRQGQSKAAISALEVLVHREPANLLYAKQLSSLYIKEGNSKKALPLLERILEQNPSGEPNLLLIAARTLIQQGRTVEKGIYYLEYYLSLYPEDTKIVEELERSREVAAESLVPILERDGAELLWDKLQAIPESRNVIFKLIAEKLVATEEISSETAVLEVLQHHNLLDDDDNTRLVSNYLKLGNRPKAYKLITELVRGGDRSEFLLAQKAELEVKFGRSTEALKSYLKASKEYPSSSQFLRQVIRLSGELGMVQDLRFGVAKLHNFQPDKFLSLHLLAARSYELNGLFAESKKLYTHLLRNTGLESEDVDLINYRYGLMLGQAGDLYGAERLFRKLLVSGSLFKETVLSYMQLLQDYGRNDDSRQVLRYYLETGGEADWRSGESIIDNKLLSTYITLLEQQRGIEKALDDAEEYAEAKGGKVLVSSEKGFDPFFRTLVRLNYLQKNKKRCRYLLSLIPKDNHGAEYRFFYKLLSHKRKEPFDSRGIIKVLDSIQDQPPVQNLYNLLPLAESLRKNDVAIDFVDEIIKRTPQSLRARVAKAGLWERGGDYGSAVKEYWSLYKDFPEEPWFYKKYLEVEFKRGNYDLILQEFASKDTQTAPKQMTLIYTRALWAKGQRSRALKQYRAMLVPSVQDMFEKQLAKSNITYDRQYERSDGIWTSFFAKDDDDVLDRLNSFDLSNGFFSKGDTGIGAIATDLYDQYGWQKEVGQEYKVRSAIVEKEYIQAEKRVGKKLDDKSPESLKDLAAIYKRLGKYDKEAEVYSYLKNYGETSPELEDSIKQNRLARAPSLAASYRISDKEGRNGEVDLSTVSLSTEYTYNPNLFSKISLDVDARNYSDAKGSEELEAVRFFLSGNYDFNIMTSIEGGIGVHKLYSGNDDVTVLGEARVTHYFDDVLTGYLAYRQDIVNDTIESLERGLISREVTGGLFLESIQGIQFGADYTRKWYSDDFEQDRIKFWAGYFDFREYSTLNLKYVYELHRSEDTGPNYIATSGTSSSTGSPYWNPSEYWSQKISFDYKHFLSDYHKVKESRDFYAVNAYIGLENGEEFIAAAQFDIFLEIKSDFLLKGELLFEHSEEYEVKSASLSLIYRW